jgi:hypothetical protein
MQNELTRKFHKSLNLALVYLEIFLCCDLDDDNIPFFNVSVITLTMYGALCVETECLERMHSLQPG